MKRATLPEHIGSILYLAGTSGYTTIYFADRKPQLYAYPLIRFAEVMPTLLRTHRMYLVNPDQVTAFRYQGLVDTYLLIGDTRLPISRRRVQSVYTALHMWGDSVAKHAVNPTVSSTNQTKKVRLKEESRLGTPVPVDVFDVEDVWSI